MSFWRNITKQDSERNKRHVERINNVEMTHDGIDQALNGIGNLFRGTRHGKSRFRWKDRGR